MSEIKKIQENEDESSSRTLIILTAIFCFESFFLLHMIMSKESFNVLTESFNRIAVGFSALAAIIFGPSIVSKELEKDRKIKEYIEKYPYDKFGIDWKIIENEIYPGAYYLFDIKLQTKHHILNMKTVYDLGWHIFLHKSEKINDTKFLSYQIGERIRTQGEAGE